MLWVIAGLILLLVGAVGITRGARPPRAGETPHCRGCDYIVSGLSTNSLARCPECGLALTTANVVHGERLRERGRIMRGCAMLVLGLALVGMGVFEPLNAVNWYRFKPAGWVISDLTSATPAVRDRAWGELTQRLAANRLSPAAQSELDALFVRLYTKGPLGLPAAKLDYLTGRFGKLTPDQQEAVFQQILGALTSNIHNTFKDACARLQRLDDEGLLSSAHHEQLTRMALAAQAEREDRLELGWLMEYLGRREAAGLLTPAQREQFLAGCFGASLEVRPLVRVGDRVPYRIRLDGRGPTMANGWSRVSMVSTQIDDRPAVPQGGSMSGNSRLGAGGSFGSSFKADAPGKHEFKSTFELAVSDGSIPTDTERAQPRWTRRTTSVRPFEILPAGAPEPWDWIDDPSLAPAIAQSIVLSNVRASDRQFDALSMTVQVAHLPANVAFDIFARAADGKEHRIGSLTAFAGTQYNTGVNAEKFPPGKRVGKVDVIFRSSEAVLKGTTDMYEAWRGEIVVRDVAVTPEN